MVGPDPFLGTLRDDRAVSSVIGTVLMLGITVTVFAAFSLVVLDGLEEEPRPPRTDLRVLAGERLLIQHQGGEALQLAHGLLVVNVGGQEQVVPLTTLGSEFDGADHWRIGTSLCISCLYPGQDIQGILLVYHNTLLLSHGQRGTGAQP
jgi:flagellin-like protein